MSDEKAGVCTYHHDPQDAASAPDLADLGQAPGDEEEAQDGQDGEDDDRDDVAPEGVAHDAQD